MLVRSDNGTPLFGIVGWKQSGKTTLTTALIAHFTKLGFRVASLKHAHHAFSIDDGPTDSARHRASGATQVAVASAKRWAIITETPRPAGGSETDSGHTPNPLVLANRLDPADILLVEGFKQANIPKLEVRRREAVQQTPLCDTIPGVVAIASDDLAPGVSGPTHFDINDIAAIADFIATHCELTRSQT
ncbi:MAG: molybdopterin-guanine dinucleotide biosynthesis protein B [Pseudomonadota bacterium]